VSAEKGWLVNACHVNRWGLRLGALLAVACSLAFVSVCVGASRADAAAPMNLRQIAAGNYSSLLGKWVEEDYSVNPENGTGPQWHSGGTDSISISASKLGTLDLLLQGRTLTHYPTDGAPEPGRVAFQDNGTYLQASLQGSAAISFWFGFYPKGTTSLSKDLGGTNNGVKLNTAKNTISIGSSGANTEVFAQVSAATKPAPAHNRACLTAAAYNRLLATHGVTVKKLDYCGQGWALTEGSRCQANGGDCDADLEVFRAVGSRWTVSSREVLCDYPHHGAASPIPSKFDWYCQSD
jgi:hypothetical protein